MKTSLLNVRPTSDTRPARAMLPCLLLAGVLASLTGCSDNQDPEGARALHERLQREDYRRWRRPPGWETRRAAQSPHSDEVDLYVNPIVAAAIDAREPLAAWPEGSIIAKDGFDGDEHVLLAVMEKRADGWYWAEYYDGEARYSGEPSICVDCHRSGEDQVRAFGLPKP